MREYFNDTFPDKLTGRDAVTSSAPIEWPARSPDLTTCDNSLWGYMKDIVSKQRYHSNDKLNAAVTAAFGTLALAMSRKMFHRTWRHITLRSEKDSIQIYWMHEIYLWVWTYGSPFRMARELTRLEPHTNLWVVTKN